MAFLRRTFLLFFIISLFAPHTPVFAKELKIPEKVKIISRQEWGADEEITFVRKEMKEIENSKQETINSEDLEKPSEIPEEDTEIERVITNDDQGRKYIWPLQYAKKIKFIVIHHTGLPNELPDDPKQEMRNIFRSHTLFKKWGDIGYHYVIDRDGNIYEGRKGGAKVIGGHAQPVNKVSIGISLMGNYDEEELPAPMLASVIALLDELIKQYKINPLGKTKYNGKIYSNIHGHMDNSAKKDPGRFFNQKFPYVRQILSYYRSKKKKANPPKYNFTPIGPRELIAAAPDEDTKFTIRLKNTGEVTWRRNTYLENISENSLPRVFAKLEHKKVVPGGLGVFKGKIPAQAGISAQMSSAWISGMSLPRLSLVINGTLRPKKEIPIPLMVEFKEKPIRVALSFAHKKPEMRSSEGLQLFENGKLVYQFPKNKIVTVAALKAGGYRVRTKVAPSGRIKFDLKNPPRLRARNNGILELVNFENRPAWNKSLNDNLFRGVVEVQKVSGKLKVINELPLEDYLKGIAEVSNGDPKEKIKTIIILARSYAKYYRDTGMKFPGKPYHLDDNPDHTQKYVGYGLELRSPNITAAVLETKGKIVTFQGKPVITPYFNQSDGRTRSAQEVWGWTNAPYLKSVPDAFCGTTQLKGHGVGLSGCGATELAKSGKTAEEIIKYYYEGVEITD